MKRLILVLLAVALVAAPAALAKGASEATITGPAIGDGITLAGEGQAGGEQLLQLAEHAGFFPAVFVTTPNPMRQKPPAGRRGPRYEIEYTMPGPDSRVVSRLTQELYPYASPAPLTYMAPGQTYFGAEKTVGGWYVAGPALRDDLVAVGLPETAPVGDGGGRDVPWAWIAAACLVGLLAATATVVVRSRRRSAPAPLAG